MTPRPDYTTSTVDGAAWTAAREAEWDISGDYDDCDRPARRYRCPDGMCGASDCERCGSEWDDEDEFDNASADAALAEGGFRDWDDFEKELDEGGEE